MKKKNNKAPIWCFIIYAFAKIDNNSSWSGNPRYLLPIAKLSLLTMKSANSAEKFTSPTSDLGYILPIKVVI